MLRHKRLDEDGGFGRIKPGCQQVDHHLSGDPALRPLVLARPGLRSPGHPDGSELLVRAVLGQQVSVAGARTLAARLVAAHGEQLSNPVAGVTHTFPDAATIASLASDEFAMPRTRGAALAAACARIAEELGNAGVGDDVVAWLVETAAARRSRAAAEAVRRESFEQGLAAGVALGVVPEQDHDVHDLAGLAVVAGFLGVPAPR